MNKERVVSMNNVEKPKNIEMNINLDTTPILYTDNIFLNVNDDGLVLDFCQKLGPSNQVRIVSRVGMSKNHAKKLIAELEKVINMSEGQIQTRVNLN